MSHRWGQVNPIDQLKAATLKGVGGASSVLEHQAWVYDRSGNRLSYQYGLRVTKGVFNNLNQLVSETAGGKMRAHGTTNEPSTVSVLSNSNPFVSAATDASNHFTAWVDVDPGVNTITVEAKDISPNSNTRTKSYQVDVEGRWVNTTYDLNGNTTAVSTNSTGVTGRVKRYDWDAENRLARITYIDDSSTEFQYDGHSRRVKQID